MYGYPFFKKYENQWNEVHQKVQNIFVFWGQGLDNNQKIIPAQ